MKKDAAQIGFSAAPNGQGGLAVVISGRLESANVEHVLELARKALEAHKPGRVTVDMARVDYLDMAGALGLTLLERQAAQEGVELEFFGLGAEQAAIKALVDPRDLARKPLKKADHGLKMVDQVGFSTLAMFQDVKAMVDFLGDFCLTALRAVRNPGLVRWGDVVLYMQRVGVEGLPIVGLISFLLGLIIAFMSSLQLSSFGANIFVASLVSVAMVRELGPIMTAILVAGRSGSAFAAEIGTMKVNEEVDALEVMGYDPAMFLALPKVLAAAIVVPLLTLYSDFLGIVGGMMVGVLGLDLTIFSYVQQTAASLAVRDVIAGIIKSLVFAAVIAGVGCQRGFMVRGSAQAVGRATTSAVVTAMFMIIVIDSMFAIILHYL